MKKTTMFFYIFFCSLFASAQSSFSCIIKDASNGEPLPGVSVILRGADPGYTSNSEGKVFIKLIANGTRIITFSSIGFKAQTLELTFPLAVADSVYTILMEHDIKEEQEVIVIASSRTESGIENLPTKVEILGIEEVNEEVGIKPGNIASLLGDVAGIQIQQMS